MALAYKTIPLAVEQEPRLVLAPGARSDAQAGRRADDASDAKDNYLTDRTFKWLATLPVDVRPIAAGRQFPRIVNRISDLWSQCEYTRLYFQSLLVARREGRSGFPPQVKGELEALQNYYFEHLSGLPAILWNAVPVNPPRIPNRAFAPHPDTTEIDIPPVTR